MNVASEKPAPAPQPRRQPALHESGKQRFRRYRPMHVDALDQRYCIQPGPWQSATPRKNAIDDAVAIIDGIKCEINESDARLTPTLL
ncbi:hypothetical protein [Bordetella bronchiseptica]|uniref:hypothetical protein n=1 Tax=Bordetella bronchiseptica TaxID=518 RepID=UPI00190F34E6|nr:hypothetical protein [Bordetella bronchiseptica]